MTITYQKPMYFDTTIKAQKQLSSSVADDLGLILNSVVGNTVTLGDSADNASGVAGSLTVNSDDNTAQITLSGSDGSVLAQAATFGHDGTLGSLTVTNGASAPAFGDKKTEVVNDTFKVSEWKDDGKGGAWESIGTYGFEIAIDGGADLGGALLVRGSDITLQGMSGSDLFIYNQDVAGTPRRTISGLTTPQADSEAATKQYVDSVAQGLDVKGSCVAATVEALPACVYNNGTMGVGATLTREGNGQLHNIDGVVIENGQRILVKNQADAAQNGIYVVTSIGGFLAPWVLTRASDMDAPNEFAGAFTFIEQGTDLADTGWVCTTNSPVNIGVDAINFVQFSSAGIVLAGNGLVKNGNTIAVQPLLNGSSENISGLSAAEAGLSIDLAATPGLEILADDGLAAKVNGAKALTITSNGIEVVADLAAALKIDSASGLQVVADSAAALTIDSASGLQVVADSAAALTIDPTSGLQVVADSAAALTIDPTSGLQVVTDGKTLAFNGAGALFAGMACTKGTNAAANKVVVFSANDTVDVVATPADAGAGNVAGIVASINGSDAYVVQSGVLPNALVGATAGTAYFMGDNGDISAALPTAENARVIQVGIAKNATDLYVQIRDLGTLAA